MKTLKGKHALAAMGVAVLLAITTPVAMAGGGGEPGDFCTFLDKGLPLGAIFQGTATVSFPDGPNANATLTINASRPGCTILGVAIPTLITSLDAQSIEHASDLVGVCFNVGTGQIRGESIFDGPACPAVGGTDEIALVVQGASNLVPNEDDGFTVDVSIKAWTLP